MKHIFKSALLLLMTVCLFAACDDDHDSNPTLTAPTEFRLNTPALANVPIDLAKSQIVELTCSQPNYGFTASTQYTIQVSLSPDMSDAAVKDGRLTATVDSSGNVVIADPNAATNNALKGDGSIKLQASATKKNAAHLDSVTLQNAVEAKVNIAEGAKLDAAGDVLVSADATHDSDRYVVEILDIAAFAKADVQVDGELKGRNVTVTANAVNSLDSKNLKSIYDGLDRTAEEITDAMGYKITVNDALADAIGSTLEDRGVFGKGGKYFDTVNNVIEQLYMPFGFADAEATISVGNAGKLTASENINVAANSTASNNFKVEIQPKLQQGDSNKLKYFTGGFVYVDTDSTATVNIDGKLEAKKNLAVTAKAVNTSIGTMVVKPPRILDNGQGAKP